MLHSGSAFNCSLENRINYYTCLSAGLIYCSLCHRCPAVYMGKTVRTLREQFGEHLQSITKSAPVFPSQSISAQMDMPQPMHWFCFLQGSVLTCKRQLSTFILCIVAQCACFMDEGPKPEIMPRV